MHAGKAPLFEVPPPSISIPQDEVSKTAPADEDLVQTNLSHAIAETTVVQEGARPLPRRILYKRAVEEESTVKPKYFSLFEKLAKLAEEEEEEPVEDDTQAPKVLQAKRLSRTGATPNGNPLAFRPRFDQPPDSLLPVADVTRWVTAVPGPSRRYGLLAALLGGLCLLLLGLLVRVWGDASRKDAVIAASLSSRGTTPKERLPAPITVSDQALGIADNALAAIRNGEFAKAADLFKEARASKVFLPGLNYQSALLALNMNDIDTAIRLIDHCIDAGEDVTDCLYLRAQSLAVGGDFVGAASSFEEAVRATPFDARNYFFWAECLRRQGSPAKALVQFEQALLRRPHPAEVDLIHFRMRLAMIEAGADSRFQEELANHLASPDPTGDVLLIAAANEMNRGNYGAALGYLERCLQVASPQLLEIRLRDPFFQNYLDRPEFAGALRPVKSPHPVPTTGRAQKPLLILESVTHVSGHLAPATGPTQKPVLIDLAKRGLLEADPANWP